MIVSAESPPRVKPELTTDELAVIAAIRDVRASGKPATIVLRVELGEVGRAGGIIISACQAPQFHARRKVAA